MHKKNFKTRSTRSRQAKRKFIRYHDHKALLNHKNQSSKKQRFTKRRNRQSKKANPVHQNLHGVKSSQQEHRKILNKLLNKYAKKAMTIQQRRKNQREKHSHSKMTNHYQHSRPNKQKSFMKTSQFHKPHYRRALKKTKDCAKPISFQELFPLVVKKDKPKPIKITPISLKFSEIWPIALKKSEKKIVSPNPFISARQAIGFIQPIPLSNIEEKNETLPSALKVNLGDVAPVCLDSNPKTTRRSSKHAFKQSATTIHHPAKSEKCQSLPISIISPITLSTPNPQSNGSCTSSNQVALHELSPLAVGNGGLLNESQASQCTNSTDLKLLAPLPLVGTAINLNLEVKKRTKKLTGVQKFLMELAKKREDSGILLFSNKGHLSMPNRLDRYLKLEIGRSNRSLIRKRPYLAKDPFDMVLKYGNRPPIEIDRLSRYLTRRKKRLLARKLRLEKQQLLEANKKKLQKIRLEELNKKKAEQKAAEERKKQPVKPKLDDPKKLPATNPRINGTHAGLAHSQSENLEDLQRMVDKMKQAWSVDHSQPFAVLQI